MSRKDDPFWKRKTLAQMTREEWESLCDGCGKCCLNKIEDEESGDIFFTRASCRLLDLKTCRCSNYARRAEIVEDCVQLTPGNVKKIKWLPQTCAYRLVAEGKDLPSWHPLVCGDSKRLHRQKHSVRDFAINEDLVDDLEDYIIDPL